MTHRTRVHVEQADEHSPTMRAALHAGREADLQLPQQQDDALEQPG
jgi:hypothetical protein